MFYYFLLHISIKKELSYLSRTCYILTNRAVYGITGFTEIEFKSVCVFQAELNILLIINILSTERVFKIQLLTLQ